jgi:hypothetical protein
MPILCRSVGRRGRWSKSALAWCRRVVLTTRIDEYGNTFWEVDGELHREGDLPAIVWADGSKVWRVRGKRHRGGGLPAIVWTGASSVGSMAFDTPPPAMKA